MKECCAGIAGTGGISVSLAHRRGVGWEYTLDVARGRSISGLDEDQGASSRAGVTMIDGVTGVC